MVSKEVTANNIRYSQRFCTMNRLVKTQTVLRKVITLTSKEILKSLGIPPFQFFRSTKQDVKILACYPCVHFSME